MVELRKRKTPPPAAAPPQKRKSSVKGKPASEKPAEEKPAEENPPSSEQAEQPAAKPEETAPEPSDGSKTSSGPPSVGGTINLDNFGGEVETNDGTKVTLQKLVDDSKAGVVLFTYPKASTPGCTTQVCLFRDAYEPLTATGLSIYGLSTDSPKANTTFKTKQNLPYPLLCDPSSTLIKAIGMHKAPKSTKRGVFVVDKQGKVLAVEGGGPAATVEVVKKVVESMGGNKEDVAGSNIEKAKNEGDTGAAGAAEPADVAAEVADTAAKLDADTGGA